MRAAASAGSWWPRRGTGSPFQHLPKTEPGGCSAGLCCLVRTLTRPHCHLVRTLTRPHVCSAGAAGVAFGGWNRRGVARRSRLGARAPARGGERGAGSRRSSSGRPPPTGRISGTLRRRGSGRTCPDRDRPSLDPAPAGIRALSGTLPRPGSGPSLEPSPDRDQGLFPGSNGHGGGQGGGFTPLSRRSACGVDAGRTESVEQGQHALAVAGWISHARAGRGRRPPTA